MCAISIENGVVSLITTNQTVTSKATLDGGIKDTLCVTQTGENISDYKCNKAGDISLSQGGNYNITGSGLNIKGDLPDEDVMLNLDAKDSTFQLLGKSAMVSLSDESKNNAGYLEAVGVMVFANNAKGNYIAATSDTAQWTSDKDSQSNVFDTCSGYNISFIEGKGNAIISNGTSDINIGENAERTMILGTEDGTDTVTDKAGSTGETEGKTLYIGGHGSAKLNALGVGLLANLILNSSTQINNTGRNTAIFEQDSYKTDEGKYYNFTDYLKSYGWESEDIEEELNYSEFSNAFDAYKVYLQQYLL